MGEITPENTTVAVLGLGHIGLPTALGLADLGWNVIGADQSTDQVEALKAGIVPFYEPGVQALLQKQLATGRFRPVPDVAGAIAPASVIFICVGTPQREDGAADLSQVEAVARTIAQNLNGYKLIVEKSTVPALTARWIRKIVERTARPHVPPNEPGTQRMPAQRSTISFDVASNPEFLQEGKALENFFCPDRIVIGAESERAIKILEAIYRPLNRPMVVTTSATAELIKHAANAFLSMKLSFMNMVSDICGPIGADVEDVARAIGFDPRIGQGFLRAGLGFGGHCLPKDLRAFIHLAADVGVETPLLKAVEQINRERVEVFLKKVRKAVGGVQGKTLAVLGLAFKPDTDDLREAPSLRIIEALSNERASLRLYDPQAMAGAKLIVRAQPGRIDYCSSPYEAASGAHALLILTEWGEFQTLDLRKAAAVMEMPVLIDGRNIYSPLAARQSGFEYYCMGREPHAQDPPEPDSHDSPEKRAVHAKS